MRLANGPASWGLVARALHWGMAALLLAMVPFGLRLARMEPSLDTLWLYGLHKGLGILLLAMALLRLLWRHLSPPPAILAEGVPPWQLRLARGTHASLYALMLGLPLAGWAASSATGIDSVAFGLWTLPRIAPVSAAWDLWGFRLHLALALALVALVALHAAGALRRWAQGDPTLRRMWRGA